MPQTDSKELLRGNAVDFAKHFIAEVDRVAGIRFVGATCPKELELTALQKRFSGLTPWQLAWLLGRLCEQKDIATNALLMRVSGLDLAKRGKKLRARWAAAPSRSRDAYSHIWDNITCVYSLALA